MIENLRAYRVDKVLIFFIVASTNFFQYAGVDLKIFQFIHLAIFASLIYVSLFSKRAINPTYETTPIKLMLILPLLSMWSCNVINGQSYILSLIVYRMHLGWLLFFYLSKKSIPLGKIYKTVFVVGLIYAIITLTQQITYPFAPFGERTVGTAYTDQIAGGVERRMGFYRFMVGGLYYGVFAFFFVLDSTHIRKRKMLLILLALGIVACGNRQTMFSVFVSMVYYYLFSRNVKNKSLIFIGIIIVSLFVYLFADAIFGRLMNVSSDMEDGRMPSYLFYWGQIIQSPLTILFGNGLPNAASEYGMRIDRFENHSVTPSDIGIVGTMYYWGVLYCLVYFFYAVKWLFNKNLSTVYKAIILSFLICSPIGAFLWEINGFMLQGLLFYLCNADVYYNKYIKNDLNNVTNRL